MESISKRIGFRSFFFITLWLLSAGSSNGQEKNVKLSLSQKVEFLSLDSTKVGVNVNYSKGYAERAIAISYQLENAKRFFRENLAINIDIRVALLDTADYTKISAGFPYGLPFISGGTVVLPADNTVGAVKEMYAPFVNSASKKVTSNLKNSGFNYEDAVDLMVDLIGLHEVGHAEIRNFGLDTRQRWFNEFMASYFAYAYMMIEEPNMAVVWDNIMHAGYEGYSPDHRSLDEFNELYTGVGVGDYVWYQNAFQERIKDIYASMGLDFIRVLKERLSNNTFQPETAEELINFLESINSGFADWSNSMKN